MAGRSITGYFLYALLNAMGWMVNHRAKLNARLKGADGWIDFSVGIRTETGSAEAAIVFNSGRARVEKRIPPACDVRLVFESDHSLRQLLGATPMEQIWMVLKGQLRMEGNQALLNLFFFLMSSMLHKGQIRSMQKEAAQREAFHLKERPSSDATSRQEMGRRQCGRLEAGGPNDSGVKYLLDPWLAQWGIEDFPRLASFLECHFTQKAEVCAERPLMMTRWFRENGFEADSTGSPWVPELRQAHALHHYLANRVPLVAEGSRLAGSTTSKPVGVLVFPDSHGTTLWGELLTVSHRAHNPYIISEETLDALHHEIYPFWARRNFKEWVRRTHDNPRCQRLDERFALYFVWKQAALSHTIADFPKLLRLGTSGMIEEVEGSLSCVAQSSSKAHTLNAMAICLKGVEAYAENLSSCAEESARNANDGLRKQELFAIAQICRKVPRYPAETFQEALQAIWIVWVALHMENTNAGLSIGRLDQWLQPFFERDISRCSTAAERDAYIKDVVDLCGDFFMRCTDHLPLTPDIANYIFGGSSSDQAITLGGVTPKGEDAVCDMTYILLKVTELLCIRDPNVNARFHPDVNSQSYLKRLCSVNLLTAATPSMHNDKAVFESLSQYGWDPEHINDWSATGCVEPTLSGRHIGHTNFEMLNMVAALEMALNNGVLPLLKSRIGPKTGSVEEGDFPDFESFFAAFTQQFAFLIDESVAYNNMLGRAHQLIRPTPLLSSMIEGCRQTGKDVTHGGALYNTSGAACIGLADVTDSLMVIKTLVYDEKKLNLEALKAAVNADFEGHAEVLAMVKERVPLFGSGSAEAVAMANRITTFAHDHFGSHTNYRGGRYTAGFWSMSNHVAYGTLSGALPSGRRKGKPFTPGLTPAPHASENLLDNIRDVASLDGRALSNNIAFNVRVVPRPGEKSESVIHTMASYVGSYFSLGGMQMQMNVVTSEMLKDARAHPENYRNLLVRISGYNAYFVTLNPDMQQELIERAEYGL